MSDDTLTSLIAEAIGRHLAPIIKWLYGVFAAVIAGTAFIVGMVHDVKQGIHDAAKEAGEAKGASALNKEALHQHETRIAILESKRGGSE